VGRHRDAATPRVLIAVRQLLRRGHGSYIGNDGGQTNDNQKLTKGGFHQGGLNFAPLQPPPKRHNLLLGLGGGGGRIQSGAERKGRGQNYHKVDDDNNDNGKGGKQGKKH
jgi:hypothetical protein